MTVAIGIYHPIYLSKTFLNSAIVSFPDRAYQPEIPMVEKDFMDSIYKGKERGY